MADSTADSEIPSSVYQNRQTFCLTILKTEFGISELTEDTVSVFLPKCTSDHLQLHSILMANFSKVKVEVRGMCPSRNFTVKIFAMK